MIRIFNFHKICFLLIAFLCIYTFKSHAENNTRDILDNYFNLKILHNWRGDFDEILRRRNIRVLVPFNRTIFFIDKGNEYGVAADLGKELEKWINKKYKFGLLSFHVVFIPKPHDQLITALLEGEGDLIAGPFVVSPQRKDLIDFTTPWIQDVKSVLVSNTEAPIIDKMEGLSGQKIIIKKSSIYSDYLSQVNKRFSEQGINPIEPFYADENIDLEDLLEAVNAQLLPYTICHDKIARIWSKIFTKLKINDNIVFSNNESAAWAIRKNSPLLMNVINEFIQTHAAGTMYGNQILNKYFSETKFIRNSLESSEVKKFSSLVDIFKKYGAKYGLDYLMLAAQGYQESQLDQAKKSPRGAVGVMQLLPYVAATKPIGIINIDKDVDANIKAGAIYLNYLKENYLDEPEINDINKTLMALSAYNAGPGNLNEFRKIARDQGLNPNVWFNNVEYGAARKVGQETVQYVSNIYKYYLAYKLIAEHESQLNAAKEHLKSVR